MKQTLLRLLLAACLVLPAATAHAEVDVATAASAISDDAGDDTPDGFVLSAAYPNPFNPRTSFSLTTEERQDVTVEIFNILGIAVERLFEGTMEANETRTFTFEADDLPSGIYLYRVRGESFTATRQMTLLK
jgi:hypothetical protein